jgi:hypothetical protein
MSAENVDPASRPHRPSRRSFLQGATVGAASLAAGSLLSRRGFGQEAPTANVPGVPIRALTTGPKFHWFGYYDKEQFDPTNRFVLSNEVDFEHRTPTAEDTIGVGMVDIENGDAWKELGRSAAWGWQQGCMLQWVPKTASSVIWNDREGDRHVSRIVDVKTGESRTVAKPIYTLSPDGRTAVTPDFARIQNLRPGYGYKGIADPYVEERAPKDSGIWRVDLETGEAKLIISLAEVAKIPHKGAPLGDVWQWFNHLLISPDGERFIFLHRWRDEFDPATGKFSDPFHTRMFTAKLDGSDLFVLDPSGHTSHFIWRDERHVCAWAKPDGKDAAFYLFEDKTRNVEIVGEGIMTVNGHNTYVPGTNGEWILNDTYPDKDRRQNPYLFHVPTGRRIPLGGFVSPKEYAGEWRCDTHPRSSRDGRLVTIDSPHGGVGRQVYLLDVSGIVG